MLADQRVRIELGLVHREEAVLSPCVLGCLVVGDQVGPVRSNEHGIRGTGEEDVEFLLIQKQRGQKSGSATAPRVLAEMRI